MAQTLWHMNARQAKPIPFNYYKNLPKPELLGPPPTILIYKISNRSQSTLLGQLKHLKVASKVFVLHQAAC